MNSIQINDILRSRCRGTFVGVFALDRLPTNLPPRRPLLLVCNTDPHTLPGRHWVVLYIGSNGWGEYFDSLNDSAVPMTFVNYLNRWCHSWIRNGRQLQSAASRFCAHYCIFFCLFRSLDYDMNAIDSCFTNDSGLNDVFVHAIICKLI